jgi:hemoglobin-like flavoprotein
MSKIRLAQYGGYIFIVRTVMTPTQIELVQDSFKHVDRQPHESGRIFFDELFQLAPHLRDLFPEDTTRLKAKFVQMLAVIVKSLDQISKVSEDVVDLGRRHMAYDVEEEHYTIFGEAFIAMLNRVLGNDLTPEISDAWSAAYDMLARVMQEAAVAPQTAEAFYSSIIRSVMAAQYGVSVAKDRTGTGRAPITHGIERGQVIRLS